MLDPELRAKMEQSQAMVAETVPSTIAQIYKEFKKEFSPEQAWTLTKVCTFALFSGKAFLE